MTLGAQPLDLVAGRFACGKSLLACLQEVLRPAVIEVLVDPSLRHSSAMLSFAAQARNHDRTFSSAEYCRLVARRISRTAFSDSSECRYTFDLIATPSAVKMSQKSSLPLSLQTFQLVLTGNIVNAELICHFFSGARCPLFSDLNCPFRARQRNVGGFAQTGIRAAKRPFLRRQRRRAVSAWWPAPRKLRQIELESVA